MVLNLMARALRQPLVDPKGQNDQVRWQHGEQDFSFRLPTLLLFLSSLYLLFKMADVRQRYL